MNIGLDVDGVLVDVRTFQLREGKRYFQKKYGISIKNPDMFEVQDVFECTKNRESHSGLSLSLIHISEPTRH